MSGPPAETRPRQTAAGSQRAIDDSRNHRGVNVGRVDDVQDGVVRVHAIGLGKAGAHRRAQSLLPIGSGDRDGARWGRHLGSAENHDDVGATAARQRGHRSLHPAFHQRFRSSVPPAGTRGQQHPDNHRRR